MVIRLDRAICALSLFLVVLGRGCMSCGAFISLDSQVREAGMGGPCAACLGISTGGAGLTQLAGARLAVSYSELYGLDELRLVAASYGGPGPTGRMGAGFRSFGAEAYREDLIWVGAGWMMGSRAAAGGSLKVMHLAIAGYGEDVTLGADVGMLLWPGADRGFTLGLLVENANAPTIGCSEDPLPTGTHVGCRWQATPQLVLAAEIFQEGVFGPQYRVGQEILLSRLLTLRAGVRTAPASFSAGVSVGNERIAFDYAWRTHPLLGATQMAGMRISLGDLTGGSG
jgi:hypothetical protein